MHIRLTIVLAKLFLPREWERKKLLQRQERGQHGVALATAAALVGLECDIYMGEVDIAKEHPNVTRMKILGANVIPVSFGLRTLKEAVDAAFAAYLKDPVNQLYAIGSVVGPHPFPMMVRDFQRIIGDEAKEQFKSNGPEIYQIILLHVLEEDQMQLGLFSAFLNDEQNQYLWG